MSFIDDLAYVYGKPTVTGDLKLCPEDFIVDEILGYDLSGEGEHWYAWIEKKGINTQDVIYLLAKHLEISPKSISYAGLKDKDGITRQWFCIHWLNKPIPELETLVFDNFQVLKSMRHHKKLKIGYLSGNNFSIKINNIQILDNVWLENRINAIRTNGIANYFGSQRFGRNAENLLKARGLLFENQKIKSPFLKGITLSAARSFVFNHMLSVRIQQGLFTEVLAGDVMMLSGTESFFIAKQDELDALNERCKTFDIKPGLPLWGKGRQSITSDALSWLENIIKPWQDWVSALSQYPKLELSYRPISINVGNLQATYRDNALSLNFSLPKGAYATMVVREIVDVLEYK